MQNFRWRLSRFLLLLFFVIIVAQQPVRSQELKGRENFEYPQKKWQLKFSVGQNLIPLQFDDFKIYLQRKISGNKAVRFGIGLRDYSCDRDYSGDIRSKYGNVYPAADYNHKIDLDSDQLMFSAAIDLIAYIKSGTTIKPYFGIGPIFEYSLTETDTDQKSWQNGSQLSTQTYITDRKILDIGFSTIMGAEWHLHRILILQVEYSLRFLYETASISYTRVTLEPNLWYSTENTSDIDYYRIETGYIKTGLSVTF